MTYMVAYREDGFEEQKGRYHLSSKLFESEELARRYAATIHPSRDAIVMQVLPNEEADQGVAAAR